MFDLIYFLGVAFLLLLLAVSFPITAAVIAAALAVCAYFSHRNAAAIRNALDRDCPVQGRR